MKKKTELMEAAIPILSENSAWWNIPKSKHTKV